MEETKKCPYCGKEILAVAKKCKHCGKWVDDDAKQPQSYQHHQGQKQGVSYGTKVFLAIIAIIILVIIALIELAVPMITN